MHWLGFADWKAVNSNDTSNSNLQGKREHVAPVNVDGNTVLEITANPPQCGFDSNQSWKKKKMCSQGVEKPVNLKPWEWTIRQNGGGGLCVYQIVEQGLKHSLSKRKQWGRLDTESRVWQLRQHVQVVYQLTGWLKSGSMRFVTGIEPVNVRHQASFLQTALRLLWFLSPPPTWISTF